MSSSFVRVAAVAATVLLGVGSALAQAPQAAASAAAPAASMPHDCKVAKHDHGAEKGMPMPKSAMCADAAASAPKAKAKPAPRHDHTKFHKNLG